MDLNNEVWSSIFYKLAEQYGWHAQIVMKMSFPLIMFYMGECPKVHRDPMMRNIIWIPANDIKKGR